MSFSLGPFKIQLLDKLRSGFRVKYNLLLDKVIEDGQGYADGIKLITHDGTELNIDISEFFYSKEIIDETFFIEYATETQAGKIRIATTEEVLAGEDDLTVVTPYKLLQFWLATQGRGVIAREDLSPGDYVYLEFTEETEGDPDSPQLVAKRAIATHHLTCASGFVEFAAASGEETSVRFSGQIDTFKESLIPGEYYYLSATNPGNISRFPTQVPGTYQQVVGYAVSDLELMVEIQRPDKIWDPVFTDIPELFFEVGPNVSYTVNLLNYLKPYNVVPEEEEEQEEDDNEGEEEDEDFEEEEEAEEDDEDEEIEEEEEEEAELGLALYFSSTGTAEMKARLIGSPPYTVTAYNGSNTSVFSTSSSDQEIEIPNSVVAALGTDTIKVVATDADGNTATRTMAKLVRDRERIIHAFLSVANGNVSGHLDKINQGDTHHMTATAVIMGEIATQSQFNAFLTSNYNPLGPDVEMDKIFALAETKTFAKRLKIGLQLGRQYDNLNNGSSITQFYGPEALIMRPGGTQPSSVPGFLITCVPSPAHPQTRAYAKKLARGAARRWESKFLAGTAAWLNLVFSDTGEGEYPAFYKNASNENDGESRGDFNPVNVALFKTRYPQYVNKSHNDIATASHGSALDLDWKEHHAVVLAEFEAEVFDDLYSAYPQLRKCQMEAIDVGSAVDGLSHLRRTQNIKRRVRPTTGMIKMNDNPQSGNRMSFISAMATSLGYLYGGCTIAFEPSPTNQDFGSAEARGQVVTEVNEGMKPMAISWSFFDHGVDNVNYLLGATSFNQGQLRPGKQQYKVVSGTKTLPRLLRNISDVFTSGAYGGWEDAYGAFRTSSGVTHPDTVSVDNLYEGENAPYDPDTDPGPDPAPDPVDDGDAEEGDDGSGPGGTPVTPPGQDSDGQSPGWGYRFLGLPSWVTTHTVVFDQMTIGGSPTSSGTWKAFLEVISQTRQRYLQEIVLTVLTPTKNKFVLLDTSGDEPVVIGPLPGSYPLPDKWDVVDTISGRHDAWQLSLDGGGESNDQLDYLTVSNEVAETNSGEYQMFEEDGGIVTEAGQFRLFATTSLRGTIVSRNNISFTLYDEEFESKIQFFLTKGGADLGKILLDGTSAFVNPETHNIRYLVADVEHDKAVVKLTTKPGEVLFSRDIDLAGPDTDGAYSLYASDKAIAEGAYTTIIDLYLDDELVSSRYADFVINKKKAAAQGGFLKLVTKGANSTNLTVIDTLEADGNLNELPEDSWDVLSDSDSDPFDYEEHVLFQAKPSGLFEVDTSLYTGNPPYVNYGYPVTSSEYTIFGDSGSLDIGGIHDNDTTFRVIVNRRLGGASGAIVAKFTADFSFGTLKVIEDVPLLNIVDYVAGAGLSEEILSSIKKFSVRVDNFGIEIEEPTNPAKNWLRIKANGVKLSNIEKIPGRRLIGNLTDGLATPYAVEVVDIIGEIADGVPSVGAIVDYLGDLLDTTITGTVNFIPKYVTAHTLGNSVMQEAGSNIGIGISPGYKLDVGGSIRAKSGFFFSGDSSSAVIGGLVMDNANLFSRFSILPNTAPIDGRPQIMISANGSGDYAGFGKTFIMSLEDASSVGRIYFQTGSPRANTVIMLENHNTLFLGQIESAVTTGTAPFIINSTTLNVNLNADLLDGQHGPYYLDWNNFTNYKSVIAGNGMTGGSVLSSNATLTLGTPSTLDASTTNAVTTTSHTHAITTANLVQGANVTLTGTLTNRLIGAGNVTIAVNSLPFSGLTSLPSSVLDHGITNVYIKTEIDGFLITKEPVFSKGDIIQGTGLSITGSTLLNKLVGVDDVTFALATSGVSAGTYQSVTVDIYGRVTGGANPTTRDGYGITDVYRVIDVDFLLGFKADKTTTITVSGTTGRITSSANAQSLAADRTWIIDLDTSGVGAGTYRSVTVDVYGRVTAGTNPNTLTGYGLNTTVYTKTEVDGLISGSGTVGGSGTKNRLTKWDVPGTGILDSRVYDEGTGAVEVLASLQVSGGGKFSSTSEGLIKPRMTYTQRHAMSPTVGEVVFQTDTVGSAVTGEYTYFPSGWYPTTYGSTAL